jgi:hypothetical protein
MRIASRPLFPPFFRRSIRAFAGGLRLSRCRALFDDHTGSGAVPL